MLKSASVLLISTVGVTIVVFLSGCQTNDPVPGGTITYTIPNLRESGFLGDYSKMTLARQPQFAVVGRKVYVNPEADLTSYNKVMIEPVSFDFYDNAVELNDKEKERLTRYLNDWLNLKLKDRFRKVAVADAQTLRVRTAITSLSVPDDVFPRDNQIADVFMAVVELELLDSVNGRRFFAMVDPMGGIRFTIAREDLSKEREMYINWMDGLSADMKDQAVKAHTPALVP